MDVATTPSAFGFYLVCRVHETRLQCHNRELWFGNVNKIKKRSRPSLAAPSSSIALAEFAALLAKRLSICAIFSMLGLDAFAVRAVIVVVINLPMFGWVLRGVCVICGYFCHLGKNPLLDNDGFRSFVSFGK